MVRADLTTSQSVALFRTFLLSCRIWVSRHKIAWIPFTVCQKISAFLINVLRVCPQHFSSSWFNLIVFWTNCPKERTFSMSDFHILAQNVRDRPSPNSLAQWPVSLTQMLNTTTRKPFEILFVMLTVAIVFPFALGTGCLHENEKAAKYSGSCIQVM